MVVSTDQNSIKLIVLIISINLINQIQSNDYQLNKKLNSLDNDSMKELGRYRNQMIFLLENKQLNKNFSTTTDHHQINEKLNSLNDSNDRSVQNLTGELKKLKEIDSNSKQTRTFLFGNRLSNFPPHSRPESEQLENNFNNKIDNCFSNETTTLPNKHQQQTNTTEMIELTTSLSFEPITIKWSNQQTLFNRPAIKNECIPKEIPNATYKLRHNGLIVRYYCNDQYVAKGLTRLYCLLGKWSGDFPKCVHIKKFKLDLSL